LFNEELNEKIPLYIPVVWYESEMLDNQGTTHDCCIPDIIEQQGQQIITEKLNSYCRDVNSCNWQPVNQSEKENLNKELGLLAETHFASSEDETQQRIYKTMMSLWQNAETFSMERR
jgi:hypothetical protein